MPLYHMDRQNAQGPVNVSAAVGAVNENPPESLAIDSETAEREQAAREAEAPSESSAEQGVTEPHIDQPRSGTTSPDSIGSGPPD
jgi:hypothetical protein